MKTLHMISFTLVIIGGLNWGLMGLFNFNLVNAILGSVGGLEKLVYVLVGVSAVILMLGHKGDCKTCIAK
ncbi:MAG: DUF378 domain-containing protein [Patescibacteria group bacterium]